MSPEDFRRLALALPEAVESAHMGHPDFRIGKTIFASLWPDKGRGVVAIDPGDQAMLCEMQPASFAPASGSWGAKGWTNIALAVAEPDAVRHALELAWRRKAPKRLL